MAGLVYSAIASLDGYTADSAGTFDWAAPDEEVHAFVNDLERPVGTYLLGRRMYEVMRFWETAPTVDPTSAAMGDYAAIWQAADKIVYSATLPRALTSRTRLERSIDPRSVLDILGATDRPVGIGGATIAGWAITEGLVDQFHLITAPVVVGGGTPALPSGVRVDLTLVDQRRFASGFTYHHYRR
jgi:dihydrofolate reductase